MGARKIPPLPAFGQGAKIGLYGGSFNPPHEGHRLVCDIALRRLKLDQVWIIPTIGNPLKRSSDLAPLAERCAALHDLKLSPEIKILDLEARIHTRYTIDTLSYVFARGFGARFVWLMGADNLSQFSRWKNWRAIAALAPIAVIDRPGSHFRASASPAAHALARYRLPERFASVLAMRAPPAWVYLHDRRSPAASRILREKNLTKF